ncbi:hypothetical protein [Serratia fonticola]|uniref:hypothetical protein n=1 Tax=Serratia fonticola TaxID=47917 RepID=UPI00192BDE75|nr:hypothetical protein [Serratia fonticola]MBL5906107.1 hypothetical protein [Serratia fonticola]
MEYIEDFSDERQKAWCIQCGSAIGSHETNWDHVPTKSLLDKPLPAHVPQIEVCKKCNNSFSLDEEYVVTFLSCVQSGSTSSYAQRNSSIGRALARNPSFAARIEATKRIELCPDGTEKIIWQPEIERIHRIVLKNARGHAFHEYGEPMLDDPEQIWAMPLVLLNPDQRQYFEDVNSSIWPEVGSRMMTRIATGLDLVNGWISIQDGIYRYSVFQEKGLVVRSVIHNYLATEVIWS